MTKFPLPKRAMAIFAHPDDVDFGASGTLSQWADKGVHITSGVGTVRIINTKVAGSIWNKTL